METRNLKLDFETAKQWFGGYVSELKDLAIKTYPELAKEELPKSWWELGNVEGFFVGADCSIHFANCSVTDHSKNVFATKQEAEASISCAMYSQLLNAYKDESIESFIEIAREHESKVRPMLELFFFENAKAAFYVGLLSQLMKTYNDGWAPNYLNEYEEKFVIRFSSEILIISLFCGVRNFLAFKDRLTAELFLKNFRELIEQAKPLL